MALFLLIVELITIHVSYLSFVLPFLFRYLQEIGYTDTIIDVRSNRVRSLLGLNDENINEDSNGGGGNAGGPGGRMVNGGDASGATGNPP